jgi:CO/xanthine dehydrogenase Mo-binding subunit
VPLQDDEIYHDGQHLGVVVAESFEQAVYAASLAKVTYQSQPPVVTLYEERAQKNATSELRDSDGKRTLSRADSVGEYAHCCQRT